MSLIGVHGATPVPPVTAAPQTSIYSTPVANPNPPRKADPRFRSFVERYVIECARHFRTDHAGHAEDQWQAVQNAKRMYALIKRVGEGAAYEEAEGF